MDDKEREVYAQQHKDRTDLAEQHANTWGKFMQRKEEYRQKYGAAYADILLKKDEKDLVTEFNQDHQHLAQQHDEQWLAYFEDDTLTAVEQNHERGDRQGPNAVDPTLPQPITSHQREPLFINPFKQAGKEQKPLSTQQTRDIDQSQKLMSAMRSVPKDADQKENAPVADKTPLSMSARFSQGLSFTRVTEKAEKLPEREKDMDRE